MHKGDAELPPGKKLQGHFPSGVQPDAGEFEYSVDCRLSLYHVSDYRRFHSFRQVRPLPAAEASLRV
jgi:hypothetical protein